MNKKIDDSENNKNENDDELIENTFDINIFLDNDKDYDNVYKSMKEKKMQEKEQEILDMGIELPKESPSDSIKILKKDRHGQSLSNISYDYIFKVSLIGGSTISFILVSKSLIFLHK